MSVWKFGELAPVLNGVGMAAAKGGSLDVEGLAAELGRSAVNIEELLDQLGQMGLILAPRDEPELPPSLTRAGSQYLEMRGQLDDDVLAFLPGVIDDLHARKALLHGGSVLVDEFRYQVLHGGARSHAKGLVPAAFVEAVDDVMAINLFAAAIALMARLSSGYPAGCLAEEIMAVELIENAAFWIEMEADKGALDPEATQPAIDALRGIFELFEDADVLDLFEMEEPGDAALAGHSWINQQAGVVDQRVEAWFRPFGHVAETGYLHERRRAN